MLLLYASKHVRHRHIATSKTVWLPLLHTWHNHLWQVYKNTPVAVSMVNNVATHTSHHYQGVRVCSVISHNLVIWYSRPSHCRDGRQSKAPWIPSTLSVCGSQTGSPETTGQQTLILPRITVRENNAQSYKPHSEQQTCTVYLLVNLSFVQTLYFVPLEVTVSIQASERSGEVMLMSYGLQKYFCL